MQAMIDVSAKRQKPAGWLGGWRRWFGLNGARPRHEAKCQMATPLSNAGADCEPTHLPGRWPDAESLLAARITALNGRSDAALDKASPAQGKST
jgi:hypothetical protein